MHLKQRLNSHIQLINNINFIQAAIVESAEKVPFKIRTIEEGNFFLTAAFNIMYTKSVKKCCYTLKFCYLLKNIVTHGVFSVNSSILSSNMPKC